MLRTFRSPIKQSTSPPVAISGRRRVVRRLRRHPILYGILAVMVIEFMSGMATGFDLSVRLYYSLGILLIAGWLWARSSSERMTAEVKRPKGPFTVGDTISETVLLRNGGGTPKAWVEVEDHTDLPGIQFKRVASLGLLVAFDRLEMTGTVTRRGEYTIGPLVARTSDPFSMFPQEVVFGGEDTVLVYPKIVSIPDFASPSIHLVGDNSRTQRARILSTDVASVREYEPGDALGRIHWLSTARTGELMVKQFDQGSSSQMWVLFDQHKDSQVADGDETTDEMGATVAASVIDRYSRGSLPVGYLAHGSQSLIALPDRSEHQRELIMRHIAASRPMGEVTILESLTELERDLGQNTSLVVITAANYGPWIDALGGLAKRGVRVNVVLIDRASFGGDSNAEARESLTITGVSTYPLALGDSISNALLSPVGGTREGLRQATFRTRSERTESPDPAGLAESAGDDR
ncbi:MAG: DUF58 domain-containing protein [Chloroflexi bacterium]|nr:DUF58 domain-containing protein [Chloroflexota bacterium]